VRAGRARRARRSSCRTQDRHQLARQTKVNRCLGEEPGLMLEPSLLLSRVIPALALGAPCRSERSRTSVGACFRRGHFARVLSVNEDSKGESGAGR
jgi:hypothetical protein